MTALFHFIFEVLKIFILSFLYSKFIVTIYMLFAQNRTTTFYKKIIQPKRRLWLITGGLLFLFMLTNIGSHGLGDSAYVPISFSKHISNVDWSEYGTLEGVETADKNRIETTDWIVKDGILCGNLKSWFYSYNSSFFVYDISNEKLKEFSTEQSYNEYARVENLPISSELQSFEDNYGDYWRGWRFWLLP